MLYMTALAVYLVDMHPASPPAAYACRAAFALTCLSHQPACAFVSSDTHNISIAIGLATWICNSPAERSLCPVAARFALNMQQPVAQLFLSAARPHSTLTCAPHPEQRDGST
ncbi:hypothetical protein ACJQWK_10906 [Exserohilum turcicum]